MQRPLSRAPQQRDHFLATKRRLAHKESEQLEAGLARLLQFILHGGSFGSCKELVLYASISVGGIPLQNHTDLSATKRRFENSLPAVLKSLVACPAAATQLRCRSSRFVTIPSQMAGEVQAASSTGTPEIPNRLFFRIGDVAELAGLEAYVLRYWETEFSVLKPKKSSNGQRQYRRKDVEIVLEIKRLLYEKRYTIEGARNLLAPNHKGGPQAKAAVRQRGGRSKESAQQALLFQATPDAFAAIRKELVEILELLK